MTTAYFIAGAIFIALSLLWAYVQYRKERNKKYEDATKAAKDAVDAHDTDELIASVRERMLNRK